MQPPYDPALREAVRLRMSPPNRESVAQIARDTGITRQTIYNWRSQWQKQGGAYQQRCPLGALISAPQQAYFGWKIMGCVIGC